MRLGLLREEARQIVALALEGFLHLLDARLGRRRDGVDFLDRDLAFLVHPKILVTRSIPFTSAAMSSAPLYTPKLARAVAGTPSASISGCAQ